MVSDRAWPQDIERPHEADAWGRGMTKVGSLGPSGLAHLGSGHEGVPLPPLHGRAHAAHIYTVATGVRLPG